MSLNKKRYIAALTVVGSTLALISCKDPSENDNTAVVYAPFADAGYKSDTYTDGAGMSVTISHSEAVLRCPAGTVIPTGFSGTATKFKEGGTYRLTPLFGGGGGVIYYEIQIFPASGHYQFFDAQLATGPAAYLPLQFSTAQLDFVCGSEFSINGASVSWTSSGV